jgi:CRP-like cAMP-binding protein
VNLQNALLRLDKGGPERAAVEAGEIDAIVDYASSNVILLPVARRALREAANRAAGEEREAAKQAIANSVLAALPRAECQSLLAGLEPVTLRFGEVLHERDVPIRYVYFPIDCVVSLLMTVETHHNLAVALVGHEGMVGIPLALGIDVSFHRALVQGTGTAMRMRADLFHKKLLQSQTLQHALYRFKHALVGQISQTVVCCTFHSVEARLARYLLMTADRARPGKICLIQEFLADMLGVRRVGVSRAAGDFQKRKLIDYARGKITIVDRKRLAAASCECYQVIKRMYDSAHAER